jgi:transposase-like protein
MGGWDLAEAAEKMAQRRQQAARGESGRTVKAGKKDQPALRYDCEKCGGTFEVAIKNFDTWSKARVVCPACGHFS